MALACGTLVNKEPLEMKIELTVIEDLGIKLYGHLPPVISEMVANAWDADATTVEISLDDGDIAKSSKIVVKDNGHGMSYDEIGKHYLRVGRKKRDEDGSDETPLGRRVMGRKGIGKLSVFGIATNAEIKTVRKGRKSVFQMNVNDMLEHARTHGTYRPRTTIRDEPAPEANGTTITLTGLKRKTKIDAKSIKRDIAKHFSVIGDNFQVSVNKEWILPSDKFKRDDLEQEWPIHECLVPDKPEWTVSGWIGATKQPLDGKYCGVAITARGKLIQSPTMFEIKSGGKFSYSYLTGEISAEFFDMDEDFISTNRQSLIWDTPQGEALKDWGAATLKKISEELVQKRKTKREVVIRKDPEIESWLGSLTAPAKKRADKIIQIVTSGERADNNKRIELVRFAMASFEQSVFLEMMEQIGDHPDPISLLEVFKEWDVVEAREMERLVVGRLKAIKQLGKHIDENAREVPTLHTYFKNWPWILEPTWTKWQDEVRFSKLLKEKYPELKLGEADRRIDFVSIGVGDTIHVVELKRPSHSVNKDDVIQLIDYVKFVNENLGNYTKRGYNNVAGYIVAGKVSKDRVTLELVENGERARRYVRTYENLIAVANNLHSEFKEKLNEFGREP